MGKNGVDGWTVVVADVQSRGKGRGRHGWSSPKGGLWLSILLRPVTAPDGIYLFQFLASAAVRRAIEEESGVRVLLKWPNDLVTEHGKVGGILVKSRTVYGKLDFIVIGIGVNVNVPRNRLPANATSLLTESERSYPLRSLLRSILDHIEEKVATTIDSEKIMKEWWNHCIHRGQSVTVKTPNRELEGIARGIDREGRIILETETEGFQYISEGSLHMIQSSEK